MVKWTIKNNLENKNYFAKKYFTLLFFLEIVKKLFSSGSLFWVQLPEYIW